MKIVFFKAAPKRHIQLRNQLLACLVVLCSLCTAQVRVLDTSMHYLRIGDQPEWDEFANANTKNALTIFFDVRNITEHTLSLRQYEVKQDWIILLNDQKIGSLVVDVNAMRTYFKLPPGMLKKENNKLTIQAVTNNPDDIVVSEIAIDERPIETALTESIINIEIVDGKTNKLTPCRITIVDSKNTLQSTGTKTAAHLAIRPGFLYTADGKVSLLVPQGTYTIYATRGFEYSVDSAKIRVSIGQHLNKKLVIKQEVETTGWISCDTHIHTLTHSGHGDATDRERALTIAGEGIELPVITEHNRILDFTQVAKTMMVDQYFTPVAGDEVTTAIGHFNVFPLLVNQEVPNYKVNTWQELSENLPSKDSAIIILNHGRDLHNKFRPFDEKRHISSAGINLEAWTLPANSMEIINSGALQHDPFQLIHDWFGLLNRGFSLTPVGASDSHDVTRYLVGQARTYIKAHDNNAANLNINDITRNFRQGKVMVSFGLLPKVTVNAKFQVGELVQSKKQTVLDIDIQGPGWIKAERVSLYVNGKKIQERKIINGNASGMKWKGRWTVPPRKHDVFLVVIAEGDGGNLPFWPIVKPYQPVSTSWRPYTMGISGPIWIDFDGDGEITPAFAYARKLFDNFGTDLKKLFTELGNYDEAVAVQVASLLHQNGIDLSGDNVVSALTTATLEIRQAFNKYSNELRKSKE